MAYVKALDVDPDAELAVLVALSKEVPSKLPYSRKLQDAANFAWARRRPSNRLQRRGPRVE